MRIGYLLNVFPMLSETFVIREIRQLGALTGEPPVLASMHRPGPGAVRESCQELADGCLYFKDIDKNRLRGAAAGLAGFALARPARTVRALTSRSDAGLRDRIKTAYLARHFRDRGVSQLHTHFAWPHLENLAAIRDITGIPFTTTVHAADIFTGDKRVPGWLAKASRIIAISEYNRSYLREHLGAADERIAVVRCGIPMRRYPLTPPPESKTPMILSLGRMVEKKGFDVLLRALALLRGRGVDFTAVIAGDGPLRNELKALAGRLGLEDRTAFPGALDPADAAELMRRCDVFALACRRAANGDMDGIPVVLMEAMAIGRPVVSTALSGIPELLGDGCGLLAAPGSPEAFADALMRVLKDRSLRATLRARGRERVESEYDSETQTRKLLDVLRGASGDRETRP